MKYFILGDKMPLRSVAFQQFVAPSCARVFGSRPSRPPILPQLYPNEGFVLAVPPRGLTALPPSSPFLSLGFGVGLQVVLGPRGWKRWVGVMVSFSHGSWHRRLLSLVLLGLAQSRHPWTLPENGPERLLFYFPVTRVRVGSDFSLSLVTSST